MARQNARRLWYEGDQDGLPFSFVLSCLSSRDGGGIYVMPALVAKANSSRA